MRKTEQRRSSKNARPHGHVYQRRKLLVTTICFFAGSTSSGHQHVVTSPSPWIQQHLAIVEHMIAQNDSLAGSCARREQRFFSNLSRSRTTINNTTHTIADWLCCGSIGTVAETCLMTNINNSRSFLCSTCGWSCFNTTAIVGGHCHLSKCFNFLVRCCKCNRNFFIKLSLISRVVHHILHRIHLAECVSNKAIIDIDVFVWRLPNLVLSCFFWCWMKTWKRHADFGHTGKTAAFRGVTLSNTGLWNKPHQKGCWQYCCCDIAITVMVILCVTFLSTMLYLTDHHDYIRHINWPDSLFDRFSFRFFFKFFDSYYYCRRLLFSSPSCWYFKVH